MDGGGGGGMYGGKIATFRDLAGKWWIPWGQIAGSGCGQIAVRSFVKGCVV